MIKQLSTRTVYQSKWMKVREDQVEFANGSPGTFGVVEKPDFAMIIPWENGGFYLVNQYRYPVQGSFWEFPQGSYEEQPDLDPATLATQELQEETGLQAKSMEKIGFLYEAYGYCNQGFHVFLAQDFTRGQQQLEESEQGLEMGYFSLAEFEQMILTGQIKDAPTISAYGLLQAKKWCK